MRSLHYLIVLSLLSPMFLRGELVEGAAGDRITITTESQADLRRIEIKVPGLSDAQTVLKPQLMVNAASGRFDLIYFPIDTSQHLGDYTIMDRGNFPLKLLISFPDSLSMVLSGETIPFTAISHTYDFTSESYFIDLSLERAASSSHSVGSTNSTMGSENNLISSHGGTVNAAGSAGSGETFLRAAGYTALLAVILLVIILVYRYSFKRPFLAGNSGGETISQLGPTVKNILPRTLGNIKAVYAQMQNIFRPHGSTSLELENPQILLNGNLQEAGQKKPESMEEHIENVAEANTISFEEARLRLAMQAKETQGS